MATDDPQHPPAKSHPTIYYVKLNSLGSARWEAQIPGYHEGLLVKWRQEAVKLGKKSIEVWGRYCKLGEYPVEGV